MDNVGKSNEELLQELQELKKENESLKILYKQDIPLRQKSEELFNRRDKACLVSTTERANQKLIQELQVHQIELAMQNEELLLEKKKAEVVSEKFIELYDFAPIGYFTLSKGGNIIELNHSGAKMLGKNFYRLKKNIFSFFVSDDTKPIFINFLEKVFKSKTKETCEVVLISYISTPKYIYLTGIVADDGEQCLVSAMDITERKQVEEDLKESEEHFRTLFEKASEGIIYLSKDGEIKGINESFAKIHGYTIEEMKNIKLHDLDLKDISDMPEKFNRMSNGEDLIFEVQHFHKDGHIIYFEVVAFMMTIKKEIYFIAFHRDITQRKRAEQEIKQAKEQFEIFFNTVPEAIIITRQSDGCIVDINTGFTTFTGYAPDEIIGKTSNDINIYKNFEDRQKIAKELMSKGYCYNFESEIRLKNGSFRTVIMQVTFFNLGGVSHILNIAHDITIRKQAEAEIQLQNLELAEINASKDKFFSIIAHDLRSPFNGLLGLTKMMAENINDFSLPDLQKISKSLNSSANNMYQLLNNLLEWSKMQRGITQFNPKSYNLTSIAKKNIDIAYEFAKQKEIEIITKIPDDLRVTADEQMLNTILRNIISNAIKFTTRCGKVEIGVISGGVHLDTTIYIKDSGIGMSGSTIKKLFKLDINVSQPGTDNEKGTGLGLILCKEFIEKHGGKIWVESEEGEGSTFYFSL
jgi:PAS domain S-box-containing protein